jgi:hypothetical protein
MVVDFEHHYIPVELARRMGINTETRTIVEEDGFAKANVHAQLFNLDAQIQDMDRAGIDVAVQTCILGWDTPLENCRLLNDCAAKIQKNTGDASSAWPISRPRGRAGFERTGASCW